MAGRTRARLARLGAVALASLLLSACGVVRDTVDGFHGEPPSAAGANTQSTDESGDTDVIDVVITVESDAGTASSVFIDVKGRKHSETVDEPAVDLPYTREFQVPSDTLFPLQETRVEATASPGASQISCSIRYAGEVVATHVAKGTSAKATCENQFEFGPS
ncbi:MAG: hypothetical protein LBS27_10640 [Bifidobacteriaceae bacterium]|jgi:hypothetical protein|nr:hypothetical protein [Bifidobacteriaceae bacterium]